MRTKPAVADGPPVPKTRKSGWRVVWRVLVVIVLLVPAFVGEPGALVVALAAITAVLTAMWQPTGRRIGFGTVVCAVSVASLVLDAAYFGSPGMALVWMPFELAGLLVLLGRSVRLIPPGRVVAVTALVAVAAMALPLRFTLNESPPKWDTSVLGLALVLFPLAVATGIGVYLRGLDSRRVEAVTEARVQQRLEIARLLHDFVAHEVTGIVVEVQAAQFVRYDEDDVRETFARIEEAGLRALDSMDRAVATMRDGTRTEATARLYGLGDLPELVRRFSRAAGPSVRCDLGDGTAGKVGRDAEETAYAVVLEALTNIRRHAPDADAVRVSVELAEGPAVEVSVVDDGGRGVADGATRVTGGSGLTGLRARVEATGGTLVAGPHGSGWRVAAAFPFSEPVRHR
jgi:signal transduction histidine kinase